MHKIGVKSLCLLNSGYNAEKFKIVYTDQYVKESTKDEVNHTTNMGFGINLLFQVLGPNQETILIVNINFPVLHTLGIKKNTGSSSYAEICMVDPTRLLPMVSVKTTKLWL